jgi:DNA repair protein RecO (recombination protein O)
MALLETEALVLRTYNLAEADKIVVCLTRRAGLIRAVAKGSRKLKNRFGAALEPFTLLNISCFQKEHQELISLRQVEILKSNFSLFGNTEILTALAYMADLVVQFSPPYQPNEKLFRMVKACLEAIAASPTDLNAILRYFEVWLLKLEGFLPDLTHCGDCNRNLEEGEAVVVGYDFSLRCLSCNQGHGYSLSKKVYSRLRATHKVSPQVFAEESRAVPTSVQREMAEFTHHLIGRILERQPGVRLTVQ